MILKKEELMNINAGTVFVAFGIQMLAKKLANTLLKLIRK